MFGARLLTTGVAVLVGVAVGGNGVQCRGGHEFMGREHDPENILVLIPKRSYVMTTLEMIGNYAIQPTWDDGHHTGIYTWDYLRHLCPPEVEPT